MNFVLRTAHAEEKKKGGHTTPKCAQLCLRSSYIDKRNRFYIAFVCLYIGAWQRRVRICIYGKLLPGSPRGWLH